MPKKEKYDFSGWATRNGLKCSDGRVIDRDAFSANNGQTVPLVWQHMHDSPENVLGHALLENRNEGVYAYCKFNNTSYGQHAKELVRHGDVRSLSIYANQLKQNGPHVLHGSIKEVSLVLAGANPGALIDFPVLAHADGSTTEVYDEATIYNGFGIDNVDGYIEHAEDEEDEEEENKVAKEKDKTVKDVFDTFTDEQKQLAYFLIGKALEGKGGEEMAHADVEDDEEDDGEESGATVKEVYDSLTKEQKDVLHFMIGKAIEDKESGEEDEDDEDYEDEEDDEIEHSDEGGYYMTHNVFESDMDEDVLTHSQLDTIITDAKRYGSLKESFLQHSDEYGIENIDYLFPEAKTLNNPPEFIKREDSWVKVVMNGVHHTPFSRIKSSFADITEDEARAKGYIKGNLKKEEVFGLLKRVTTPTTVYKKQKLDRDDVIDITDFDVIAWLKTEMRGMLDEEIARAILFSDGRLSSSDEKINESNVRPVIKDAPLFSIRVTIEDGATEGDTAKNFIRGAIKARKNYRGSGNPILFVGEDIITDMLLLEDTLGHSLYKTIDELATKLRMSKIVSVPDEVIPTGFYGVALNLNDYNVGADKGGSVNMFDDFDIDYNQMKYLIETRISGALIKPYSAMVFARTGAEAAGDGDIYPKN